MVYASGGSQLIDADKILERLGIGPGAKVAHLGCGRAGHFTIPAARLVGQDGLVYAVDILKTVLESLASRARLVGVSRIKTIWSDLEKVGATRIPVASLDFAFLINTLFQSSQQENILREAFRLTKPGGELLVIEWGDNSGLLGPEANRRVTAKTIEQLASQSGFQLKEKFPAGPYHYGLTFQKPA